MSKDDFRERLKSYSDTPDPGEWSKMEQLLDADQDDRKAGFAWWRLGAAAILVAVLSVALYQFVDFGLETEDERLETKDENLEPRAESREPGFAFEDQRLKTKDESRESGAGSRERKEDERPKNKDERLVEESKEDIIRKTKDERLVKESRTKSSESGFAAVDERRKTKNEIFVGESRIGNQESGAESRESRLEVVAEVESVDVVMEDVLNEVSAIPESAVFEKRDLFELEEVIAIEDLETEDLEIQDERMDEEEAVVDLDLNQGLTRPWFVVTEAGVKFPTVDINQNPSPGTLVPAQKLFPSYTAGLGFGRNFGKFSAEIGLTASLYQFKLGEIVDQEKIDEWNTPNNTLEAGNPIITSNEQFVINKFAVASPYLRTQYSIPLKKDFLLGLHASVLANSILNLPNQFESGQFATSNDIDQASIFDFDRVQSNSEIDQRRQNSFNFDLGLSVEKILGNRGRLALDLSYTLARGYLERGKYTALRNSEFESGGTYTITGMGPVARIRYYLHFGKYK